MELTGETKDWGRGMAEAFSMVKDQAPLVHMIANYVTASFCADAMAAMGARPLMAQAPEEMEAVSYTHLAPVPAANCPYCRTVSSRNRRMASFCVNRGIPSPSSTGATWIMR